MENNFGEFLKQKRQEKGLTQKDLASALFVSESAVSKWENNNSHPDITLLPKLSELLGVSEHELITASIDAKSRQEKVQARRWRALSFSWSLFFYIAYALALIPCFICNLAINKTLSWFWIVLASLLLAFTFTNLPKLIKKHKLILLPLSMFLALCLLLGVCCVYSGGKWFFIVSLSVLLGLIIIFSPIYIAKLSVFSKIKKFNDFISVFVDFIVLNILLIVIDMYCVANNFSTSHWYFKLGLPITFGVYLIVNLFLSVRFFRINRFLKTSIILLLSNFFLYVVPLFIKTKNTSAQKELDDINVFKANFATWNNGVAIERNVHCIICLTILVISIVFFTIGIVKQLKRK